MWCVANNDGTGCYTSKPVVGFFFLLKWLLVLFVFPVNKKQVQLFSLGTENEMFSQQMTGMNAIELLVVDNVEFAL